MERGLRTKINPVDDDIGSKELAQEIYDIIINEDNTFRFIPYHTDKERIQYLDNILMKIYNKVKQILRS